MSFKIWDTLTQAQKIVRWENVLRVLRGLSRHERKLHFDMGTWGEKTDCGTVACAAGHCGLDPWFRKQGLKYDFEQLTPDPYLVEAGKDEPAWDGNWAFDGHLEVEDFFGEVGTKNIFYDTNQRAAGKVINEVRRHITQLRKGNDLE